MHSPNRKNYPTNMQNNLHKPTPSPETPPTIDPTMQTPHGQWQPLAHVPRILEWWGWSPEFGGYLIESYPILIATIFPNFYNPIADAQKWLRTPPAIESIQCLSQ